MTKEEMRIAVAGACGLDTEKKVLGGVYVYYDKQGHVKAALPNYPKDLNAIAEAIATLSTKEFRGADGSMHNQTGDFNMHLERIIQRDTGACLQFDVINATSHQRCEAFLKTVGKWKD